MRTLLEHLISPFNGGFMVFLFNDWFANIQTSVLLVNDFDFGCFHMDWFWCWHIYGGMRLQCWSNCIHVIKTSPRITQACTPKKVVINKMKCLKVFWDQFGHSDLCLLKWHYFLEHYILYHILLYHLNFTWASNFFVFKWNTGKNEFTWN